jgi:hypothetical protein
MDNVFLEELTRDFEKELGISYSVTMCIASDVTGKVRLRLANPQYPKCGGRFPNPIKAKRRFNKFF